MGLLFERNKTGFLNPVNGTVDKLISASNGLMCLKSAIVGAIPNPAAILGGLASVAAAMISAIIGAVTTVIMERVDQIINSVLSPIRKIEEIISDLTASLIGIQNILDKATNMDNYFKNKQDCSGFAAELMNCLAQNAINKITNKVAMNVDKHIGKIANNVTKESLKVNGTIDTFVNRHTQFLVKADLQTKLLT
jgi:tetrahydromethanopterin S-methyltransferase subunit C